MNNTCRYYGTVMYHGPVQGSNGVWVGVSWDELGRGKHDGEYNGIYIVFYLTIQTINKQLNK